ncbi:hypothetical protein EDEG_00829 [Edhazardia aedis USNM 41457]|uniref:AAA+ ATPase domain-containing protein n=1 Tax=Edhazardia aedis (strain USNM 41457) TaxID=1003232 RepID=J8ZZJ1_EDHAE|nr:hypothetical protein EDEG_00829 [Edhazardia aedis USNM 41457]|eukprot:EJW05048.1 hypothetical protein EDEG_00829 [Edhazardia aedis USNM 41457]
MRDIVKKRQETKKEDTSVIDERKIYKIKSAENRKIEKDLTVDLLVYLVMKSMGRSTNYQKQERKNEFSIMTVLAAICFLIAIGSFCYNLISSNSRGLGGFKKDTRYTLIEDVSSFGSMIYYGQRKLINAMIYTLLNMFNDFDNMDDETLNQYYRPSHKNMLFHGPPGTGKTMCVKALAYSLDINQKLKKKFLEYNKDLEKMKNFDIEELFKMQSTVSLIIVSPASLMSKFVGETEKNIDHIFSVASKLAKTTTVIIFIDEIENMTRTRSELSSDHSSHALSQFLCALDGILTPLRQKSILIGATNKISMIDEAIKRRFANIYEMKKPNDTQRDHLIFEFTKKDVFYDAEKHLRLVDETDGMTQDTINKIFTTLLRSKKKTCDAISYDTMLKAVKDFKKSGYVDLGKDASDIYLDDEMEKNLMHNKFGIPILG